MSVSSAMPRDKTPSIKLSEILDAHGIEGGRVNVSPGDFSALNALDQITVVVRAPVNQNGFFVGNYFSNKWMRGRTAMFREFDE